MKKIFCWTGVQSGNKSESEDVAIWHKNGKIVIALDLWDSQR
jgi:hypothetical protein